MWAEHMSWLFHQPQLQPESVPRPVPSHGLGEASWLGDDQRGSENTNEPVTGKCKTLASGWPTAATPYVWHCRWAAAEAPQQRRPQGTRCCSFGNGFAYNATPNAVDAAPPTAASPATAGAVASTNWSRHPPRPARTSSTEQNHAKMVCLQLLDQVLQLLALQCRSMHPAGQLENQLTSRLSTRTATR